MTIKYTIMMFATLIALVSSGYALGNISAKSGKTNVLNFIPALIAIFMVTIVFAIVEMSRAGRL